MKTIVTDYNGTETFEDSQGVEILEDEYVVRNLVDGSTVETIYPKREVLKIQTFLDFDLLEEMRKLANEREEKLVAEREALLTRSKLGLS